VALVSKSNPEFGKYQTTGVSLCNAHLRDIQNHVFSLLPVRLLPDDDYRPGRHRNSS
jgi:hypothetical protein